VRERIGPRPIIMAVVKANAYGHGIEIIARNAIENGDVGYFGVATEEEGIELRKLTSLPIAVLTSALEDEADTFIQNDLEFTLSEYHLLSAIAQRAKALQKKAKVHLKIDTGMRRIGVEPNDAVAFAQAIHDHQDWVKFVGISTHFATSDELDTIFFNKQVNVFTDITKTIRNEVCPVPLAHAANSGAILQYASLSSFDMVRPGIMLYGYAPSYELQQVVGSELTPVLKLTSAVVHTKWVKQGEGVSYNLRWHAERDTNIVTLPVGYGDGYSRLLTNHSSVNLNGKSYPVRGTICMDQIMLETGDDKIPIGAEATLISYDDPAISAWGLAKSIGTIPYEILTNITARVPRIAI
jgi:alanine racemase